MFKIAQNPTFVRPVKVQVPEGEGFREESCTATFAGLPDETVKGFDLASAEGTKEFLRAVVVRLGDVADSDNRPVEYSDGLREDLLGWPFVRTALARAYFEGISGARVGN